VIDPFGRHISYLRVSVTDRCDFRCVYCMAEDMTFLPKSQVLSLEELDRLCTAFIEKGVRKLRLTGGEPLVRRDVMTLINSLGRHLKTGALDELTLTTNGSQLARFAGDLARAGVKRINVSLDTLDADTFQQITRWGRLDQVLDGIRAAKDAGLAVKINTVALRGVNEDEIFELIDWTGREGHDLTFIETMPLGEVDVARVDNYLPLSLLKAQIGQRFTVQETDYRTGGPARYVTLAETGQRLGFITPLTHNFCESCNRVRVTCTGMLYMCLGQEDSADLRAPLRADTDNTALNAAQGACRVAPYERHRRLITVSQQPKIAFAASTRLAKAGEVLPRLEARYDHVPLEEADVVVALGGDGFMLRTLHRMFDRQIPVYGMNAGSLGFLMNEYREDGLIERITKAEEVILHPLRMHAVTVEGDVHEALAVNEVSLLRETYQAAKIRILIDGKVRMEELVCDGTLVATPAGSTAYNLSVHGPIVPIGAEILCLTPISAFRPRRWRGALLPHDAQVTFEVIDAVERPVSATADNFEVRDVARVEVAEDRHVALKLLFDEGHNLADRIVAEQFVP